LDIRVLIDYKDTVSVINWVYSGIIDKMNGYCTVQNFWRNYTKAKSLGTKSLYVCCANIWEIVNDCVHCTLYTVHIFWIVHFLTQNSNCPHMFATWYFKFRLFDLREIIVWNILGLRHCVAKM